MTIQDSISAAAVPTNEIARRTQLLQSNGYHWLDPETQVTLASSQNSDQNMLDQAGAFGQALNGAAQAVGSAVNQVGHFFEDPVLQKQPSKALQLQQYLLNRQGFMPVAETDLKSIQQQLVSKGYLDQADVTGVWTPQSQQAFYQASQDHLQAQRQSNDGGGFSFGKAVGGFFKSFLPSHWIPALAGAVTSLPGDIRDLAAEVYGDVGSTAADIADIIPGVHIDAEHYRAQLSADVESLFGNKETAAQNHQRHWSQLVNGLNAMLVAAPVTKAVTAVKDAAGEATAKGLTKDIGWEAAKRGPGVVSSSIYSYGANGEKVGLLNSRMFTNSPILRQITPPIRAAFDPNGKFVGAYYTMRTAAAYPQRFPVVQLAGTIQGQGALTGAGVTGLGNLEDKVGVHNALHDQIYALGTIGGPFGTALDLLSAGLHGPLETRYTRAAEADGKRVLIGVNPSKTAGEIVDAANSGMDAALRPVGAAWAFQAGTGIPYAKLVEDLGSEADAQWFLNAKLNEFAAAAHAHGALDGKNLSGDQWVTAFKQATHEAYSNPAILQTSRDGMLANLADLAAAFKRDSNVIVGDGRQAYSKGVKSLLAAWHDAHTLYANHSSELITPLTQAALKDAQGEHAFTAALGDTPTGPEPGGYNGWLKSNNPQAAPGSFGIATQEAQTAQDARRVAQGLTADLNKATPAENTDATAAQIAAQRKVRATALNYLAVQLGVREYEMERLDTQGLVDLINAKSHTLASDVYLPLDPSPQVTQLIQSLQAKGYKPVFGTDIGHAFTPPIIEPSVINGAASRARKIATAMGLNNLPVSTTAAGALRREAVIAKWQEAINTGKLRVPPGWNASRMWEYLHVQLESRAELSGIESGTLRWLGRAGFKNQVNYRADFLEAEGMTRAEAVAKARNEIEAHIARGTQPLEVSGGQFRKALMTVPAALTNELRNLPADTPLMDEQSARLAHHLYLGALGDEPTWAFGLGKVEDLFRAGFGFLGARTAQVPVIRRVGVLPNELIRFRNKYRFTVDPMFSARRITKTALKMGLADVRFTVRPFESMVKQGTLNDDLATLNRIYPMKGADGFDNMDRVLHEQDVFGLYNPRHFMAFAAGEWKRQGLADDEIKRLLTRTFTYGDRTALERTVSTFFYPFSFEKTLYRNLGGYLMDRPGQRLLLNGALQAYDALSKHYGISDWLKKHAPVLQEFQKLNAFDHGVGPGQWGGINAPYAPALWNVLMPQKYGAMTQPDLNLVLQTFPLLRDLNSMLTGYSVYSGTAHGGNVLQQAEIGYWGLRNAVDDVTRWATGDKRSPWNPQHPAETYQAQQTDAWSLRNAMILKLAPVLDYNYHHAGSELRFTANPSLPAAIQGQPINRSAIDEIVHRFYPAFDPAAAQSIAVTRQTQEKRYRSDLTATDPARAAVFNDFANAATKIMPLMQRAEEDPANYGKLAAATAAFRQFAVNAAEQDPAFLKYYTLFWQSRFGPIEELSL